MSTSKLIDAPIPGENYTSDTRNYPWHRPPDLVGYDEILEYLIGKISKEKPTDRLFAMLEYGVDVSTLTSILMLSHIGNADQSRFSTWMRHWTDGLILFMAASIPLPTAWSTTGLVALLLTFLLSASWKSKFANAGSR